MAKREKKWYDGLPDAAKYARKEREEEKARAKDEEAYQAGRLVDRIISAGVADGYANYIVKEVDGNQVNIKHMKWGDGYHDHYFRGGGWFPKKEIVRHLKMEDSWREFTEKHSRKEA